MSDQNQSQNLRNLEAEENADAAEAQAPGLPETKVKCPGCGYEFEVTFGAVSAEFRQS